MDDKLISTTLFVKPHVRKFLLSASSNHANKLIIDNRKNPSASVVSPIILLFLAKKRAFYRHSAQENKCKIDNSFVPLTILLSMSAFNRFGALIRDCDHLRINNMFDEIFRNMLFSFVVASRLYGKASTIDSILDFCSMYDITEEDVQAETLRRDLYRKGLKLN